MSSKIIIIVTVILIIASFTVLFVVEARNHNYDYHKSWSVIYFEDPSGNSLDFAIENHEGESGKYIYTISVDGTDIIQGDVDIAAGVKQEIAPVISEEKLSSGSRVTVDVKYNDQNYKIYKDLI